MADPHHADHHILRRIAEALGTDVTSLLDERAGAVASLHETLELLTTFEGITDLGGRRVCLDFVRSVAEQQRLGNAHRLPGPVAGASRRGEDDAVAEDRVHERGSL